MTSIDAEVQTNSDTNKNHEDPKDSNENKTLFCKQHVASVSPSNGYTKYFIIHPSTKMFAFGAGTSSTTQATPGIVRREGRVGAQGIYFPVPKKTLLKYDTPAGITIRNLSIGNSKGKKRYIYEKSPRSQGKFYCTCHVDRRSPAWLTFKSSFDQRKLRFAASVNDEMRLKTLLENGVDPNGYDEQLRTALHLAACRGYSNIVRLLLQYGANPNRKDSLGNTPLHLAACTNHVEVVTLLLKAGTDVKSNDLYGRNPLQLAQSKLKLLQRGNFNEDSQKVKEEVKKVIDMMLTFLHKKGQDTEMELLNAFQTRLNLSQTKEEFETDVRDLLVSLDNLNISKESVTSE